MCLLPLPCFRCHRPPTPHPQGVGAHFRARIPAFSHHRCESTRLLSHVCTDNDERYVPTSVVPYFFAFLAFHRIRKLQIRSVPGGVQLLLVFVHLFQSANQRRQRVRARHQSQHTFVLARNNLSNLMCAGRCMLYK